MNEKDVVEYYLEQKLLVRINSSIVPLYGQWINIEGVTYRVKAVSFAIDHASDVCKRQMRANIDLVKR